MAFPYEHARAAFDYFSSEADENIAFMENAGGSQVPRCVPSAICEYFAQHYAQLGAGYDRSARAGQIVHDAHTWLELLMNAQQQGQAVIGSSTSQLAFNLAAAFAAVLRPGDNIVLQEASHESVLGPWVRLAAATSCEVRWWRADRRSGDSRLGELAAAVGPSTRVVVVTHVSNLLGEILDLGALVRLVRERSPEAQVVADGVAFAPHRAMDVSSWGVDWYLWSAYKVYGPHVGIMYGRDDAYERLLAAGGQGPNHYFVPSEDMTYKFELGGPCHEACAGLLALQDYLLHLLRSQQPQAAPIAPQSRQDAQQSASTQEPLAQFPHTSHPGQQVVPPPHHHQTQTAAQPPLTADTASVLLTAHGSSDPLPPPTPLSPSNAPAAAPESARLSSKPHAPPAATTSTKSTAATPAIAPATAISASGLLRGVLLTRQQVEEAFALMSAMEAPLQEVLLSYLSTHPAVRLVGPAVADPAVRVPTISFVHVRKSSVRVAQELQAAGFAVRCGHMYARRLAEALTEEGALLAEEAAARQSLEGPHVVISKGSAAAGQADCEELPRAVGFGGGAYGFDVQRAVDEGVVRVSLLHYNTPGEVARLVEALHSVLG